MINNLYQHDESIEYGIFVEITSLLSQFKNKETRNECIINFLDAFNYCDTEINAKLQKKCIWLFTENFKDLKHPFLKNKSVDTLTLFSPEKKKESKYKAWSPNSLPEGWSKVGWLSPSPSCS